MTYPDNLDKLLRYSKIANVDNGFIKVNTANLKEILEAIGKMDPDTPVGIVAVIGPIESGKSFLTNFLVQFAREKGHGGWMSKITSNTINGKPMMERGFAWDSVDSENFFRGDRQNGGIYLWPEPYLVTKQGKTEAMLVWIMHMDMHEVTNESAEPLERFLALACSTILEIKPATSDKIRLLETCQWTPSRAPKIPVSKNDFCKDVFFVVRTAEKFQKILDGKEAKEKLLENVNDPKQKEVYKALLENLQYVRLGCLANINTELHRKDGVLNHTALKTLSETIKNIVAQFLDCQEIKSKTTSEGSLTLGRMENFITIVSQKTNMLDERAGHFSSASKYAQHAGHQQPSTFPKMPLRATKDGEKRLSVKEQNKTKKGKQNVQSPHKTLIGIFPPEQKTKIRVAAQGQIKLEKTQRAKRALTEETSCKRILQDRKEKLCQQTKITKKKMQEKLLPLAILQTERAFHLTVEHWIKNMLSTSNISEVNSIYGYVMDSVAEEYRPLISNLKVYKEFVKRVETSCKPKCTEILESFHNKLLNFCQRMEVHFAFRSPFHTDKLEQLLQTEFVTVTKSASNDDFARQFINLAGKKLITLYHKENKIISECERTSAHIVNKQLTDIYHTQMRRYLRDAPYIFENLQKIHLKLLENLVIAFESACGIQYYGAKSLATKSKCFEVAISKLVLKYKEENETILRIRTQKINKIRENAKHAYNGKVGKEILDRYPDGAEETVLNKLHENIQNEAIKLLEIEIRHKAPKDNHLNLYKQAFKIYIDGYWPEILKINQQRLIEQSKRKKNEEDEKAQQAQNAESCTQLSSPASHGVDSFLLPLVFHMQSSRVVMAMAVENRLEIILNEFGEPETPGIIARSSNNTLIYGTEAVASKENCDEKHGAFVFSIVDFFTTRNFVWSRTHTIEGKDYHIGIEFLLGFLLGKLKQAAEMKMNGRFETTLIAVPFWLSPPQRLQLTYAAKAAGFPKVYLVNEALAAAYNFIESNQRTMTSKIENVLVLSENMAKVDVFVYSYSGKEKKPKMVGNSSNYGVNCEVKTGFFRTAKKLWSYVSHNPFQNKQQKIENACKHALQVAKKELGINARVSLKESFYICENQTQWEATLQEACTVFGEMSSNYLKANNAVIAGAVWLSMHKNEIESLSKDEFEEGLCHMDDGKSRPTSPNLESCHVEALTKQLASVLGPAVPLEDPTLRKAKADVIRRCNEMIGKIHAEEYNIKSPLAKEVVIQQISISKDIAMQPSGHSMDVVLAQIESLGKIEDKYKK